MGAFTYMLGVLLQEDGLHHMPQLRSWTSRTIAHVKSQLADRLGTLITKGSES
jgi:hypothetical protein